MLNFNLVKRILTPAGGNVSQPGGSKVDQPPGDGTGEPPSAPDAGGEED